MKNEKLYQVSTSVTDGILEIVVTGDVTRCDIPEVQKEIDTLRTEKGDLILVDLRAVSKGKTYADTVHYLKRPEGATGKTAILDNPENEFIKPFLERLSFGTHLRLKWFCDADEAKDWLKYGPNAKFNLKLDKDD